MKIIAGILSLSLMLLVTGWTHEGHKHGEPEKSATAKTTPEKLRGNTVWMGEVLDLNCYAPHEGQGAKHATCAVKCINDGAPIGLLVEGTVYLVIGKTHDMNLAKMFGPLGGQKAKVTGNVTQKGGMQFLIVQKVEKP
ncbi:MAG: hypothetical protein HY399_02145 [Elusimicrobia bacterium]|nr:hypothetical protein [Elusimicrobiota bacterium]